MLFYRTVKFDGDLSPDWAGTLDEAHRVLKMHHNMPEARIELFDVPTDKAGVLELLNGGDVDTLGLGAQRTWLLTPRKGLKEVPNGE